jgi:hypothetical protein
MKATKCSVYFWWPKKNRPVWPVFLGSKRIAYLLFSVMYSTAAFIASSLRSARPPLGGM